MKLFLRRSPAVFASLPFVPAVNKESEETSDADVDAIANRDRFQFFFPCASIELANIAVVDAGDRLENLWTGAFGYRLG